MCCFKLHYSKERTSNHKLLNRYISCIPFDRRWRTSHVASVFWQFQLAHGTYDCWWNGSLTIPVSAISISFPRSREIAISRSRNLAISQSRDLWLLVIWRHEITFDGSYDYRQKWSKEWRDVKLDRHFWWREQSGIWPLDRNVRVSRRTWQRLLSRVEYFSRFDFASSWSGNPMLRPYWTPCIHK
jgi:hypothetical protein